MVTLHNGWRGFLYPFLLPADHARRTFGMDDFSRPGVRRKSINTPPSIPQAYGTRFWER